jgi:hypothetical protein
MLRAQVRGFRRLKLFGFVAVLALLTVCGIYESSRCALCPLRPAFDLLRCSDDKYAHFLHDAITNTLVNATFATIVDRGDFWDWAQG